MSEPEEEWTSTMDMNERLMTTQEAAEALGLSVSTVKRLVESGELQAVKTPGGHRRISGLALSDYSGRRGTKPPSVIPFSGRNAPVVTEQQRPAQESLDFWRETLHTALLNSRVEEARHAIRTVHGALGGAAELADQLIAPVMTRIGHGWQSGRLEIFQEHLACHLLSDILFELVRQARSRNSRSTREGRTMMAVGATPEGDHYTLSGILCELTLLELGWDARNMGCHLPLIEFSHAITEMKPQIAWLSVHFVENEQAFVHDLHLVRETCRTMRTRLVVGGRALTPTMRRDVSDSNVVFAEDMQTLMDLSRSFGPEIRSAIESTGNHHRGLHDSR
jgi:excisionase family DNA binding protein